jgi:hypothetical protein
MKAAHDHHRVTPEGREAGQQHARLCEKAISKIGEPDERCKTCAFRAGTVPNGCLQTQLDVLKCVVEKKPFMCHHDLSMPCFGWYAISAAIAGKIPPGMTVPWDMSPPDEAFDTVERAHAKRERRAEKRRHLAARGI